MNTLSVSLQTVVLLAASNVFMTFVWYAHLTNLAERPWFVGARRTRVTARTALHSRRVVWTTTV